MVNNFNELISRYGVFDDYSKPIKNMGDLHLIIDYLLTDLKLEYQKIIDDLVKKLENGGIIIQPVPCKDAKNIIISLIIEDLKKPRNELNTSYLFTYDDIANKYGVSKSFVTLVAAKNNLSRRKVDKNEIFKDNSESNIEPTK